jgi:hypothetical protein
VDESETGSAKLWSDAEGVRPRSGPVEGVWGNRAVSPAGLASLTGGVASAAQGYNGPVDRDSQDTLSVTFERVQPRLFGVVPTLGALGLGLATLVVALIAFALGHTLLGLALLVPTLGLLALFVETARRFRPSDAASRAALGLGERLRDWTGFTTASTLAWSRASRELLAARRELAALRAEHRRTQLELGGAAYREDGAEMQRLRARMRALEEQAQELERGTHHAVREAERRIGEERLAIQPTEVVRLEGDRPAAE